jgi:hypothetical protein
MAWLGTKHVCQVQVVQVHKWLQLVITPFMYILSATWSTNVNTFQPHIETHYKHTYISNNLIHHWVYINTDTRYHPLLSQPRHTQVGDTTPKIVHKVRNLIKGIPVVTVSSTLVYLSYASKWWGRPRTCSQLQWSSCLGCSLTHRGISMCWCARNCCR